MLLSSICRKPAVIRHFPRDRMNPNSSKLRACVRLFAGAVALLIAGRAAALTLPKGVAQGPSVEGITEYRLPNGLKVLLFPDASKPTVTVNVTYLVGSRHENYGETGMAHLLEHLMFKGAPNNRDDHRAVRRARHAVQRHHLARPHQLLRSVPGRRRQSPMGAADGGGPHGPFLHRQEGPRLRDDGGAQRVRERREFAHLGAVQAHAERRLRLAQLRPRHHRQPQRHRERRHRQPAGVLPHLVPAGQRRAAGGRQIRPGQHARLHRAEVRRHPEAGARAAEILDRRADPGRRAQFQRAAPGRRPDRRPWLQGAFVAARRQRRAVVRLRHPRQWAGRAPAQAADRQRQGERSVRIRPDRLRARPAGVRRGGQEGRSDRAGARRHDGSGGGVRAPSGHAGGNGAGAPQYHQRDRQEPERPGSGSASRCRRRSRWATGACTSSAANASPPSAPRMWRACRRATCGATTA